MGDNEKIYGELMTINRKVGEVTSEVKSFRKEYDDGKRDARANAKRQHEKLDDVRRRLQHKVDKADIKPLMKANWILTNWKIFFLIASAASVAMAVVKVRQ